MELWHILIGVTWYRKGINLDYSQREDMIHSTSLDTLHESHVPDMCPICPCICRSRGRTRAYAGHGEVPVHMPVTGTYPCICRSRVPIQSSESITIHSIHNNTNDLFNQSGWLLSSISYFIFSLEQIIHDIPTWYNIVFNTNLVIISSNVEFIKYKPVSFLQLIHLTYIISPNLYNQINATETWQIP